jgi:predicted nucleic acid-binding protein
VSPGRPVIPDLDAWSRAFGRLDPEPRAVHAFRELARERRILTLGWIRQELLARLDDERQATRLAWILSGYPEIVLRPDDHLAAAELIRRLRRSGVRLPSRAALLWSAAQRVGAGIWSLDRRWHELSRHGAPLAEPG